MIIAYVLTRVDFWSGDSS